jgi:hypothetical protein
MLALASVPGQVACRSDLGNALYTQIAAPASTLANWKAQDSPQTSLPIAVMGLAISAGMPIRVDPIDGLGYPAIANASQGGPIPTQFGLSHGFTRILGLAGVSAAAGAGCVIQTESFTQPNWSAVLVSGAALLTPGSQYWLSQATAGKITDNYALINVAVLGDAEYSVGWASSTTTLVFDGTIGSYI